jgi:hypothetical protein
MTWKPLKTVTFGADFFTTQQAPSVQALLAPIVETPGVQMFDFVEDEKVQDSTGATPTGFEHGYVDPLGRLVTLSVRKAF